MTGLLVIVIAYLLGGIPFGYVLVRLTTGKDIRSSGSGNIGATNVLRTTGRAAGVATLLLDVAKGYFAVLIAARMTDDDPLWMSLSALAVMAGHAYPVFLKFHGGKAVASFIGAFLYLTPLPLAAVLVLFVITVAATRAISAGSIMAAGTFPLGVWLILHPPAPVLIASADRGRVHCLPSQIEYGTTALRQRKSIQLVQEMNLAIIGAGSWGTALSIVLAPKFDRVQLWAHEQGFNLAARIKPRTRENDLYLKGFKLAVNVETVTDLGTAAVHGAEIVLGVMPSHHARGLYTRMLPHIGDSMTFVSATKGIETGTLLRMSEVIAEVTSAKKIAALSGPTFAREVARGEPAAVVVSSLDKQVAMDVQTAFSGPSLRLYTNQDPIGVEVGAALKNVIAIGAGVCQGLGLGNNTLAALIT